MTSTWVVSEVGGRLRQDDTRKLADAYHIAKSWLRERQVQGYKVHQVSGREWELSSTSLEDLTIRITEWDF